MEPQMNPEMPQAPAGHSKAPIIAFVVAIAVIGGIVWYVLGKDDASPVVTATPSPIAANEQTYRNDKYGFEIQLPTDWKVTEDDIDVSFYSPENYKNLQNGISPDITFRLNRVNLEEPKSPATSVVYNAIPFTTFTAPGYPDSVYLYYETTKNNNKYSFVSWMTQGKQVLPQILSTFKFTTPSLSIDASGKRVYSDSRYDYEFRFPADWKFATYEGGVVAVGAKKVLSAEEYQTLDLPAGIFVIIPEELFGSIVGYDSFPTTTIGADRISVKYFEEVYGSNTDNPAWANMTGRTYYVSFPDREKINGYEGLRIMISYPNSQTNISAYTQILSSFKFTK